MEGSGDDTPAGGRDDRAPLRRKSRLNVVRQAHHERTQLTALACDLVGQNRSGGTLEIMRIAGVLVEVGRGCRRQRFPPYVTVSTAFARARVRRTLTAVRGRMRSPDGMKWNPGSPSRSAPGFVAQATRLRYNRVPEYAALLPGDSTMLQSLGWRSGARVSSQHCGGCRPLLSQLQ